MISDFKLTQNDFQSTLKISNRVATSCKQTAIHVALIQTAVFSEIQTVSFAVPGCRIARVFDHLKSKFIVAS